jgi:hypothetical protein
MRYCREVPGLDRGAVDLTMRPPSAALWLSAQQLSLPAHALATRVPALGAALARVFADTWREEANAWDVKGLDVHGTAAGVAVRLQLLAADLDGKDAYRLTPAVCGSASLSDRMRPRRSRGCGQATMQASCANPALPT